MKSSPFTLTKQKLSRKAAADKKARDIAAAKTHLQENVRKHRINASDRDQIQICIMMVTKLKEYQ